MPKLRTESFAPGGDFRWLRSDHGIWNGRTESLDIGAFVAATHYPNGYIPSGYPVALVGGQLVPYAAANEVQTVNLGAATAGTITIGFDGETTAAIAFNASAATVQAALEALSNVQPGDVTVTGGPLPGTITLTFGGRYSGTDVPQVVVTPTGLTGGTVTVATASAGGGAPAGANVLAGHIFTDQPVVPGSTEDLNVPVLDHGRVNPAFVPQPGFAPPSRANNATTIVYR